MSHLENRPVDQEIVTPPRRRNSLLVAKRGTVAVLVALCAPLLAMTVGLGIEASGWIVSQQGMLQRTADMAAIAGALAYSSGTATTQVAAIQAAYVAEINGASGVRSPATRVWNATPPTLSDNLVSIQIVNGVQNPNDTAFQATVQYKVPLLFSFLALKVPTITLSARAIAELVPSQTGKYCVLTTDTSAATSVSTAGVSDSNGATVKSHPVRHSGQRNRPGYAGPVQRGHAQRAIPGDQWDLPLPGV